MASVEVELAPVEVECEGRNCLTPPDDAPVYALVRIKDYKPEKCVLNPGVRWSYPCFYKGIEVSCDLSPFREAIEMFQQKYKDKYDGGAILYAVYCRGRGLRWYVVFDDPEEGYCYTLVYDNMTDDCLIL